MFPFPVIHHQLLIFAFARSQPFHLPSRAVPPLSLLWPSVFISVELNDTSASRLGPQNRPSAGSLPIVPTWSNQSTAPKPPSGLRLGPAWPRNSALKFTLGGKLPFVLDSLRRPIGLPMRSSADGSPAMSFQQAPHMIVIPILITAMRVFGAAGFCGFGPPIGSVRWPRSSRVASVVNAATESLGPRELPI